MKQKRVPAFLLSLSLLLTTAVPALAASFSDVSPGAWYADAVSWVSEQGFMGGYGGGMFAPGEPISRAQFTAVLYRAAGSPEIDEPASFADVAETAYYASAVNWAVDWGLMGGYGNGYFGSNDPVTRQQVAAVFWRYAGSPGVSGGPDFDDAAGIASYAVGASVWSVDNGILRTEDNRFRPAANASRAEIAFGLMGWIKSQTPAVTENGTYTTKEDVSLYIHLYGHLPANFITKQEARALGWPGGSLEPYAPGMCIGGDFYGNYEGLLPDGYSYRECDINTLGAEKRGAERLVYSNDHTAGENLIYYTADHYATFELLYGTAEE